MPRSARWSTLAAALTIAALAGSGGALRAAAPRVVVLGFDGASADRAEKLMAEGRLPNLAALGRRGGYSRLASSNPAQSPVSWATIATGWNPGKTGIYDFLRRMPSKDGSLPPTAIGIGISEPVQRDVLPLWVRAAIVLGAGAVGGAAGVGVILALYAGKSRVRRPKGLFQGTMTGAAALFAGAAYVVLGWIPASVPYARNLRDGEPFWATLDKKGVRCIALEAPLSFPADRMHCGGCLSGLGVPDVQGTWGTFAKWTDDVQAPAETETGGVGYFVEPGAESFDLVLVGPKNPRADSAAVDAARLAADTEKYKRDAAFDWPPFRRRASETKEEILRLAGRLTAHVAAALDRGKGIRLTTAEGVSVGLVPGAWSELVPVVYSVSPVAKIRANARFLLESAGSVPGAAPWKPFSLFVAPVQFDPAALPPNAEIASPMSFAADLARANGPFETLGWPELTNPVKDDVLSDRDFLSHIDILRRNRERRLMERLARGDWDCLFAMFSEPDRVQHAFYRHVDEKSPRHDPTTAAEFAGEIDRAYVEMDRLVGEVSTAVGPDTHMVVVSDHGFAPFRRAVNLNNFLCARGFQIRSHDVGRKKVGDLSGGMFFEGVKWPETKAYAIGLGNLYLNLAGREPRGAVQPADAEKLMAEIEAQLLELRDKDGAKVVRNVYRGRSLYHGARLREAPDLVVGFEWGYRVSWQNCLGAVDEDVIVDNTQCWSGDHCSVDPELVPGILFSSLPLAPTAAPHVTDVAPSILSLFGAAGPDPDGKPFFGR